MKIAVLGTGTVGQTIASKLVSLGHEVRLGARDAYNQKAVAWAGRAGPLASFGTFADAARFGELAFNCTAGVASLKALELAGAPALSGKILVDVANPLDFSRGFPPTLAVSNHDSLGEQIQRAFPDTRVVKSLNTVNSEVMVDPSRVPGDHVMFVCGEDEAAKARVTEILKEWFGWGTVLDLGGIGSARGMEAYLLLWVRMWRALGTGDFNVGVSYAM